MKTLIAVSAVIWPGLFAYLAAGGLKRLRIRREGRAARARQDRQIAAIIADATPDEIAELLTPAGTGAMS